MLRADHLGYTIEGKVLLKDVSLQLLPGEVHVLLGPNGAGKSTLLSLLAADLKPGHGQIELNGRPMQEWRAMDLARSRAVLPQRDNLRFGFTAEEVVALGRLPCRKQRPERERAIVAETLAAAGVTHLAQRRYPTLSGGERARVQFARVLAQIWESSAHPRYLLLDEPTANLDLAHQHDCLRTARQFAASGVGVLAILHDPNLAMLYADRVTLLNNGRVLASGEPVSVLSVEHIAQVYGITVSLHVIAGASRPLIAVTG